MHLYGHLLRFLPAPIAGVVFATLYGAAIVLIAVLTSLDAADFDYGRY